MYSKDPNRLIYFVSVVLIPSRADYVKRFATEEALREQEHNDSTDSESSMSDFSENEAQDMEL